MPDVDLEPYRWTSDRDKPREPVFGSGWPLGVGALVGFIGAVCAIHFGFGAFAAGMAGVVGAAIGAAITDAIH